MEFQGLVSLADKFVSDKGDTYLTFTDCEFGGQVKITMKGQNINLPFGIPVMANVKVKPGLAKGGGVFLTYQSGEFAKV
jgi:hypothetical protein